MTYYSGDISRKEILDAAKKVFVKKGYSGARVQEIADEALVNKGMIFYYYDTKEKLYEAAFIDIFKEMMPLHFDILKTNMSIKEKLYIYIDKLLESSTSNPELITFLINEINLYPERTMKLVIDDNIINYEMLQKQCNIEHKKGLIKKIDIKEILMFLTSVSLFPVLGRFIYTSLYGFKNVDQFLNNHKERAKALKLYIDNNLDIV